MEEYVNNFKTINASPKANYFNNNFTEKRKISQMPSTGVLDPMPEKYSLSKLINSVTNYRKESGTEFKIDVASIKPNRLFHVESNKTLGFGQDNPYRASFKSKFKTISPSKDNNNIDNSIINDNLEKNAINKENSKKTLIDFFPVDKLIKIETKFISLISKIKNINQLRDEYIIWINEFKNSPFYEFHFLFKNVFDNESQVTENASNLIRNYTNLLIISNIICFWIANNNTKNININNNILENEEIKTVYELMINNHKLYLLICLFILIEANIINNNENVYVLRLIEQIKAYLSKVLRNFKNRILVLNEIKSITKNLVNQINKIINQNNYYFQELFYYVNNLNKIEISRLFEIFEQIKNNNYLYNNNLNKNNYNTLIIQSNNNNNSKRNYYKKIGKLNEHKNNTQLTNGLYIKKTIPNMQKNNKKVTNKIINIIINNNNPNINYDNQNQLSINYINNNKNNRNRINQNFNNNFPQELNEFNGQQNSITINLNNTDNFLYNNYINNNTNNFQQKKTNYNNNFTAKNINNMKYTFNSNLKYNNNYNNNILSPKHRLIQPEPPFLPPILNKSENSQKKFTLILDLDETIVRYKVNENNQDEAKVIFRPGLFYFLNKVYPLFDIVIWTVATKEYADPIIDIIEEKKKYFIARLFREHATIKNNSYVKDLTKLGRDISTIIIIDDKQVSFSFQKQNGILIKPFYGTYFELKNDFILYDLFKILTKIILDKSQDVRHGISQYQYEIQQKISKNSSQNNFDNNIDEKILYKNKTNFINNNINTNVNNNNINNIPLINNINNITPNYNNNQKINRCYSMIDSLGFYKFSKK